LSFLNCSESGFAPAEKHWEQHSRQHLPWVLWKDVMDGAWQGPSQSCCEAKATLVFFLGVQREQFGYPRGLWGPMEPISHRMLGLSTLSGGSTYLCILLSLRGVWAGFQEPRASVEVSRA
jgi:hypothetical protein